MWHPDGGECWLCRSILLNVEAGLRDWFWALKKRYIHVHVGLVHPKRVELLQMDEDGGVRRSIPFYQKIDQDRALHSLGVRWQGGSWFGVGRDHGSTHE